MPLPDKAHQPRDVAPDAESDLAVADDSGATQDSAVAEASEANGHRQLARDGQNLQTVVIGAGAAGLAVGGCLRRAGMPVTILERTAQLGSAWRNHYDRLHLHTDRRNSGLPHLPMPRSYPRYPSRDQVVEYLEAYATHFGLEPRFGVEVRRLDRRADGWSVDTGEARIRTPRVVVATGYTQRPVRPSWPGLDGFGGTCLHSSEYRSGAPFAGARVLVVGFGNSGGEIALDLLEHAAQVSVCVRSPVNVVPRELLGLPILTISIALSRLPPRVADALTAPVGRLLYSDLHRLGLRRAADGPFQQIANRRRIPLIDIGTIERLRSGELEVRPGILEFDRGKVVFEDGLREAYDVIVLATGYRPDLRPLLGHVPGALEPDGSPVRNGVRGSDAGLYYCGFYVAPTGMLREIALEAGEIARFIEKANRGGRDWPGADRPVDARA
jgi:cation diffusion facilitator CzcD-associated flavoprotein CzcO